MIYSIHTFEITLIVGTEKFHAIKNTAYHNSKNKHKMFQDKKNPSKSVDTALSKKGINIEYHNNQYKKKIKVIVNPTKILGGNDIKELWKPSEKNSSKLICKLKEFLKGYFSGVYKLKDFNLTRVDFTANIDVGSREAVSAYIKVLNQMGGVKCFGFKYSDKDSGIDKGLSFDLEGNSNGIEFTAYDKEGQSMSKDAKGILRVEVRLKRQKAIRRYRAC